MPPVFISYRREDSQGYAGRLADRAREVFGAANVFIDVDSLQPGDDFAESIKRRLEHCEVVLVVIGPRWLGGREQHNSRLHDDTDYVRAEVELALTRDVRVVPVLVQGATLPREADLPQALHGLLRRQAIELSDTRWSYDVNRLLLALQGEPPNSERECTHNSSDGGSRERRRVDAVRDLRVDGGRAAQFLRARRVGSTLQGIVSVPWMIAGVLAIAAVGRDAEVLARHFDLWATAVAIVLGLSTVGIWTLSQAVGF